MVAKNVSSAATLPAPNLSIGVYSSGKEPITQRGLKYEIIISDNSSPVSSDR